MLLILVLKNLPVNIKTYKNIIYVNFNSTYLHLKLTSQEEKSALDN